MAGGSPFRLEAIFPSPGWHRAPPRTVPRAGHRREFGTDDASDGASWVCPDDKVCAAAPVYCGTADEVGACDGKMERDPCATPLSALLNVAPVRK